MGTKKILKGVFGDKLANFVTGLGGSKDRNSSLQYVLNLIPPDQLVAAYISDWIAAKIVDIPAEDAIREWRVWQAYKEQITQIEALEAKLGLKAKVKDSMIRARLLGGSAIIIGVDGAGDWNEPINMEAVKQGSLKYIHAVDRTEVNPTEIERNLNSEYYGMPKMYSVSGGSTQVDVHPSRVARFIGKPYPMRSMEVDGWGMSILQALDTAIKNAGLSSEGIASLVNDASVDIIRIPDFMASIGTEEYANRLIERFTLAKTAKGIVNALILDKEEEWEQVVQTFSGLPDIIKTYLNIAAGAGDIPATRLLGQAPSGLNATGDSDIRNYYDNVSAGQRNELAPTISILDEVIIRSALGSRPEEIHYKWNSLWQPTDSEKADVLLKRSQSIYALWQTGYVPDAAMSVAVANMLIEDGSLPGLEAAIEDELNEELDEDDEEVNNQFKKPPKDPVEDPAAGDEE